MDSVITEYPIKEVTDEVIDEIDSLPAVGEVSPEIVDRTVSGILTQIDTITWLREIGVSGNFGITFGDFRITIPGK